MSFDVDHLTVMKEPIEDGRGNNGIAKKFLPVDKAFVWRNDGGSFLIAIGDKLEEQIGFLAVNRQIPNLIHNHQAGA